MKKFGIILAFVLGITQIFAQDFEPNTHIFKYTRGINDTILIQPNAGDSIFRQKKMQLGFHWGSGKSITSSLRMTQSHIKSPFSHHNETVIGDIDTFDLAENLDLIMCVPNISYNLDYFCPLLCPSFTYEPTLQISNPGYDTLRPNDTTKVIFGFQKY